MTNTVTISLYDLASLLTLIERESALNEHRAALGSNLSYGYLAKHISDELVKTDRMIETIYDKYGIDIERLYEIEAEFDRLHPVA